MKFRNQPAPHLPVKPTVSVIMRDVLLALLPAVLVHVYFFGIGLLVHLVLAVTTALACEALMLRLRGKPLPLFLTDLSAVVAAVLLAFALPQLTPWWITVTGTAFAIIVAKHLYGGLGNNVFNPAMAGYVVLLIAFPAEMTRWLPPSGADAGLTALGSGDILAAIFSTTPPAGGDWDAVTMATPLDQVKTGLNSMRMMAEIKVDPAFGGMAGRGWEWVSVAVLAGGIGLLWRGVIRWHIPAGVLGGVFTCALLMSMIDSQTHSSAVFHLLSGATMLAAFFIATDPVSAATSPRGRLVYGAGIGVLIYIIRTWGNYADGVAFAVLLMNLAVPLIDHYTRPRVYGHES